MLYARVEAGTDPSPPLTEAFEVNLIGEDGTIDFSGAIDLTGYQILYTPVGAPVFSFESDESFSDYSQYEATAISGVSELPIPREDEDGGAYNVPMTEDGIVQHGLWAPFPFFGKRYETLYIAANGYVSFGYVSPYTANNFPSLATHYDIPRISFLFSDLSPSTGGSIWTRSLLDRLVITFEQVPEWLAYEAYLGVFPSGTAWTNTVQVELFYSGHIRVTYLEVATLDAICGLSDGRGVPVDPSDIFPNVAPSAFSVDLSALDEAPVRLSLDPISVQNVYAGEVIDFLVQTASATATPLLGAEWDGPVTVPFVDRGDGTGSFYWETELGQDGTYNVRFSAAEGVSTAFQDVRIYVSDPNPLPTATNLLLRSEDLFEDPSETRAVDVESVLTAEYTYNHPLKDDEPEYYSEGIPIIYWFKDGALLPAFTNHWMVNPSATRANEKWCFTITPFTIYGVRGETVMSPIVTIVAVPTITEVSPATGSTAGGTTVTLTGERLFAPLAVTFGGIAVKQFHSIDDTQIEVITPSHTAGTVDILVTTAEGSAYLPGGFAYAGGSKIVQADVNGDGGVDALDVQLVVNAVLERSVKAAVEPDANRDGLVNAMDVQAVVNEAVNN